MVKKYLGHLWVTAYKNIYYFLRYHPQGIKITLHWCTYPEFKKLMIELQRRQELNG